MGGFLNLFGVFVQVLDHVDCFLNLFCVIIRIDAKGEAIGNVDVANATAVAEIIKLRDNYKLHVAS